jgi:hypothetical protein
VKNFPKVIDSKVTLSFPSNSEYEQTEHFRAAECANIDEFLVFLVTEINNDFAERLICPDTEVLKEIREAIGLLNKSIEMQGVPPEFAEYFQEKLVAWRKKSPVYADDDKLEIVPEIHV